MFVLGFIFCSFILGTIFYFHNRAQNRENSSLQERLHHLEGQFQMMQPPLAQGGGIGGGPVDGDDGYQSGEEAVWDNIVLMYCENGGRFKVPPLNI